ncbi:MAG: cytochrome c oxidase subunit II [Betaproteobacteria bacterium]|nr:cytochrome c oxidase subunit II [Betaproteobacteria bacterium]
MSSSLTDDFERRFHHTAQRHERAWVFLSVVMIAVLFIAAVYLVVHDYGLVAKTARIYADPNTPATLADFQGDGVKQTGPTSYNVYEMGRIWSWTPGTAKSVTLPVGSHVTFYVTSADVLHGFEVQGTSINLTAIPGVVGHISYTFDKPGTYYIICNEYCGAGHQAMIGKIVITGSKKA